MKISEIPGGKQNGTKIPGKKFSKNLGIPTCSKVVLLDFGKCCFIRQWKFPAMLIGILVESRTPIDSRVGIICVYQRITLHCMPNFR